MLLRIFFVRSKSHTRNSLVNNFCHWTVQHKKTYYITQNCLVAWLLSNCKSHSINQFVLRENFQIICWLWHADDLHSFQRKHFEYFFFIFDERLFGIRDNVPYAKVFSLLLFYSHFILKKIVIHTKRSMPFKVCTNVFVFSNFESMFLPHRKREKKHRETFHIENRFINADDVITQYSPSFLPMANRNRHKNKKIGNEILTLTFSLFLSIFNRNWLS